MIFFRYKCQERNANMLAFYDILLNYANLFFFIKFQHFTEVLKHALLIANSGSETPSRKYYYASTFHMHLCCLFSVCLYVFFSYFFSQKRVADHFFFILSASLMFSSPLCLLCACLILAGWLPRW